MHPTIDFNESNARDANMVGSIETKHFHDEDTGPNQVGIMLGNESPFYEFVREERLFCAVFAHLLLTGRSNLVSFLSLLNEREAPARRIGTGSVEEAELYLEFTYLRDHWNRLGRDNDKKRVLLARLLERVPSLQSIARDLPEDISELNRRFLGTRGAQIRQDIVMPGQWSVTALYEGFKSTPEVFRDLCRFKWSFNIEPDLVILLPGASPICIEAKLESGEGSYPASSREGPLFDELFADHPHKGRVAQFELQEFMFRELLGAPCLPVVLSKSPGSATPEASVEYLTWSEVFSRLDMETSLPFVKRLVSTNRHLAIGL
jgi:hypothetical protein